MARTARLSIMVPQEMKEKVKVLAAGYGMTESALAAFVIGQWVFNTEKLTGKVMDAFASDNLMRFVQSAVSESAGADRT